VSPAERAEVRLSSQDHGDDRDWIPIGAGSWDGTGGPSWVDVGRVLRVHPQGMRREAAAPDRDGFELVAG
jgi:hypothetical protein